MLLGQAQDQYPPPPLSCVYGGSAVPEGGVGDRHLVIVFPGVGKDKGGVQRMPCPMNTSVRTMIFLDLINEVSGSGTGLIGYPPLCACTALSKHRVGVEPPF